MKIIIPDYYQYYPLSDVTKNAPGKKFIIWGKIIDFKPDENELTLNSNIEEIKFPISMQNNDQKDLLYEEIGKIVKIFGIISMNGLELQKIIPWNSDEELLSKLTRVLSD